MEHTHDRGLPMSQMQLFYHTAIRPYLEPFMDLTYNTTGKLLTSLVYFAVMVLTFAQELFATPDIWWKGLSVLVILDFLAGNFRALTDSKIEFNARRWGRTAYKIPAYIIAGLSVSAGANMFPTSLGWVQYATFSILAGIEIWSILRNLKLFALLAILFEVAANKYNLDNLGEIRDKVEKRSYENYRKHEKETFLKKDPELDGE